MFTVDIKINGHEIIKIYCHNEGPDANISILDGHPTIPMKGIKRIEKAKKLFAKLKHKYYYEVYKKGSEEKEQGTLIKGVIKHKRDEGMIKLIELICKDYEKKRRKGHE